jgi:hypothetical protein
MIAWLAAGKSLPDAQRAVAPSNEEDIHTDILFMTA